MTTAAIYIDDVNQSLELLKTKLPNAEIDGAHIVVRSALSPESTLNDHLVWLWGTLIHERRFLNRLKDDGAKIRCECTTSEAPVRLQANGAEMIHLLGIELIIKKKGAR